MYQTRQTGTASQYIPIWRKLYLLEVHTRFCVAKAMREKRPIVKGLWMSFRAQDILPVYKIAWHLVLVHCPDTVIL